jgi:c-di-GMP-binding flagellar brake protein YcgR
MFGLVELESIKIDIRLMIRFGREVLEQVENWSAIVIERDDLAIDDGSIRQPAQRRNDVRVSLVQDFPIPRVECHRAAGSHRNRSVAIQLDFPNPFRAFWQL